MFYSFEFFLCCWKKSKHFYFIKIQYIPDLEKKKFPIEQKNFKSFP